MDFRICKQLDAIDWGPSCLRMIAKYYGRTVSLDYLRNKSAYEKQDISVLEVTDTRRNNNAENAFAATFLLQYN